jgi:integrase
VAALKIWRMSLYKDPEKSEHWYASISIKGRPRIRRSTGTADKAEAQRIHDQWRADAWGSAPTGSGKTWQHAAASWLTASTRGESDRYLVRAFSENLGNPALSDITTDALTGAIGNKTAGTWNRYRNTILAILHHAEAMGWLDKVPTIPSRKTPAGRTRWLTKAEWTKLESELPAHLLAPARFALATGIRRANLLGLQWSEIDLQRKVMWIHPDDAKAGKAIGIPLSAPAIAILKGQIGQHDTHVFTYERTRKKKKECVPMAEIGESYQRAVKRAGLSGVNWHTLRHTWASWHVMNGTPLEVLQKLGGWNSLAMVLRYAHLAPEYLAGWADNADRDIYRDKSGQSDTLSGTLRQKKIRSKAA